jgi:hypothetical protein
LTKVHLLTVRGTPASMGLQHGESLRYEINRLADERIDVICTSHPMVTPSAVQLTAEETASEIARQVPHVYEESMSAARAANLPYWRLVVAGGYSDIDDRVTALCGVPRPSTSECTLFPLLNSYRQLVLAGTWDSHATAEPALALVRRKPDRGPVTLALTTAGWPMQQGITSHGLAFAIANLVAKASQRGISYIAALPNILTEPTLSRAVHRARSLTLCSARFYAFSDSAGDYAGLETDGCRYWMSDRAEVHTNHFIHQGAVDFDGRPKAMSELRRMSALRQLAQLSGTSDPDLFQMMSFNDGTEASISWQLTGRETRSCAAFVLNPAERRMTVTAGPPGLSEPATFDLDD